MWGKVVDAKRSAGLVTTSSHNCYNRAVGNLDDTMRPPSKASAQPVIFFRSVDPQLFSDRLIRLAVGLGNALDFVLFLDGEAASSKE